MLVNKGRIFRKILFTPSVRAVVDYVLGADYLLSSFSANIAKPGGAPMNLHTDQWWMPHPIDRGPSPLPVGSITREQPKFGGRSGAGNDRSMRMRQRNVDAQRFQRERTGARALYPAVTYGAAHLQQDDNNENTLAAEGSAGTAMVFDGRLWHGTGANVSSKNRFGLLTTFCGPQFRPQENFTVGARPEMLAEASPDLLALLGFKIWSGYGRVESPVAEFVSQDEKSLGELGA